MTNRPQIPHVTVREVGPRDGRMQTPRRGLLGAGAALLLGSAVQAQPANNWPTRPIRLVVSFPPGNGADVVARAIAPSLSQRLGQPVVVENRGGAGGTIGVDAVAKAAPDGHTIGMTSLSPVTIIPALRRKLPYDPVKDLAPVTLAAYGPMILLVKKDSPIDSVADLISRAKARPGALTYASLGTGTISQMVAEAFKAAAGAPIEEVPYQGSGQALIDLAGGRITLMFDGATSAAGQIAAGTVKALGVTSLKRSPVVPEVPTLDESGQPQLKGFEALGWIGMIAPAGTPRPVIDRLQAEAASILQAPDIAQRVQDIGQVVPDPNTPEQFAAYMQRDLARWTKLANDLQIVGND